MNLKSVFATCCIASLATVGSAQDVHFTNYLGKIDASTSTLALAADSDGRLYYSTFNSAFSEVRVIEDPASHIDTGTTAGTIIDTFNQMNSGRGVQSLQVTPDGTLFVAGDTGNAAFANLWKYNRTSVSPLTFTEDTAFEAQVAASSPKRRHGVAVINTSGDGLLAAAHFTGLDFFDFSGNFLNALGGGSNYMREPVYNSQDNIVYPIRNGAGSNNMIDYIFSGFSTTDGSGGARILGTLIEDGSANGASGDAAQNGFYFADQHQLITLDGRTIQEDPPRIRVWDINDSGTSLSLAYSINADNEGQPFKRFGDVVVTGNRMYVSSVSDSIIYVYGAVPASVNRWSDYESAK